MTDQHTPGPWTVVEGDGCFVVETDDRSVRFECNGLNAVGDRANACLISAAPELLHALRTMLTATTDDGKEQFAGQYPAYLETVAKPRARAAIAKATGVKS